VIRKLCTIPGIDTVRSIIIAALVCSPSRFKNKHKFWAYSMLVKYMQESDGKLYGKKMIQGRRELKNVFIGAAQSVLNFSRESSLGKYYDRMRSCGVDHNAALFNVARRLAAISLSILKHNKAYDDHYEEKQRRKLKQQKSV
jgi:transposase